MRSKVMRKSVFPQYTQPWAIKALTNSVSTSSPTRPAFLSELRQSMAIIVAGLR